MMTTKILNIGRNPPKISAAGIFDQRSFGVLHEIRYVSTACCPLAVMPIAFFRLEFDYVFFASLLTTSVSHCWNFQQEEKESS